MVQLVKNLPAMQETWVRSLGWEDPLEKGKATHSSIVAWRIHGVHGVAKSQTRLSDFHFHFKGASQVALVGKEASWQCRSCRRLRLNPWVWKIPWRRTWQSTPVFLPG